MSHTLNKLAITFHHFRQEMLLLINKKKSSLASTQNFLSVLEKNKTKNTFHTNLNVILALKSLTEAMEKTKVSNWLKNYDFDFSKNGTQKLGIIIPSNIPLVGMHDIISGLFTGYRLLIKESEKEYKFHRNLLAILTEIDSNLKSFISFEEKIREVDKIIAVGNNSSLHTFKQIFSDKPHLLRGHRNSVSIIDEQTTDAQIKALSEDIFNYFGLGCRNVSKIYLHHNVKIEKLYTNFTHWKNLINHNRYANNYTYNRTLFLLEKIHFWDNGFLLLKEDPSLHSPLSCLHFEIFEDKQKVVEDIEKKRKNIQCIVSKGYFEEEIEFGQTQYPKLNDYADGMDTIQFLTS